MREELRSTQSRIATVFIQRAFRHRHRSWIPFQLCDTHSGIASSSKSEACLSRESTDYDFVRAGLREPHPAYS
jgi:hypothetical protein